ncbi:MAG: glycoprotease/HAD-superfamily hydrolase like protein [Chloroflexi bacterium]|nr:MAG: glycoprotease/HAD-superfamily hydrolase like protein [Chloroflexota bacterium]
MKKESNQNTLMDTIKSLKAVLWDMDGVIVDTFDWHYSAWQQTFDELAQPFDMETFRKTFGMNNRLILNTVFGRELEEDFIQQVSDRKEALFRQVIKGSAELLPGVADWLERFEHMRGRQAVASSAPQANIDALLDELGIRGYFQAEAAGATLRGKPDPAVFLLAAQLLGVEPVNCLVIEDSIAGVEAAHRAGMKCVAVLTTNPAEKLAEADVIVKDLTLLDEETLEMLFAG